MNVAVLHEVRPYSGQIQNIKKFKDEKEHNSMC